MNVLFAKSIRILPAVFLLLMAGNIAHASYAQLTTASQLSATGAIATYTQPDLSSVPSPFTDLGSGYTVSFSTPSNRSFQVLHQGVSFFGDFPSGTPLLYNLGNGPDIITFGLLVNQFGITVESNVITSQTFTVSLLSGSSTDFTYSFADDGLNSFFLGAQATNGNAFDRILIQGLSNNDFVIGPLSFSPALPATVPEPTSWLLLGTGLALFFGGRRRSQQRRP